MYVTDCLSVRLCDNRNALLPCYVQYNGIVGVIFIGSNDRKFYAVSPEGLVLPCLVLYCVVCCVVLSCVVLCYAIFPCVVLLCFDLSCAVLCCVAFSCVVLSCFDLYCVVFVLCRVVLSCVVLLCVVLSCLVLSCLVLRYVALCFVLSCHVSSVSYLVVVLSKGNLLWSFETNGLIYSSAVLAGTSNLK
jgi:hypothetical protein